MTTAEKIKGGIIGLLVGDALGVPYEFHPRETIPPVDEIEFEPPAGFRRAHAGVPVGTYSDDGAQALILLNSLLECGKFDAAHFASGLVDWYDKGFMAVGGKVFDVGIQTANAIRELKRGVEPLLAGGMDEYSNGNGSLMRVLPLALWHPGSDLELVADEKADNSAFDFFCRGHLRFHLTPSFVSSRMIPFSANSSRISSDGQRVIVSDRAAAIHTVHSVPNSALWAIDFKTGEKQKLETKGDAIMPNCSPNGHRIAFWYVADGKLPNIATIPATGGEPVVIAESDASDWNPVWSPDGKYLYFSSDRGGSMNLWRVPVDEKTGRQSGEPESATTPAKYLRHITISRDGKTIGYVRYESQSNVQSIAFDPKTLKVTGEAVYITRGDREIGNPTLSPDGELFVARHPTRTQEDLVIFDKKGENWRNLTDDKFRERIPRWSPDGKKIAFYSDRSGRFQIWTITPDGSNLAQLTFSDKTAAMVPVFSPDGSRLAFTEVTEKLQYSRIFDLTKSWAEQTPQNLPPAPENKSYSARDWSKDGKKLLVIFFEPDGDETGIGVFDLEKQNFEKMTETGSTPVWLADNRHFIFIDRNALFLCDTTTKKITQLYKPSAYEIQQAMPSPDNKTILFRYLQVDADVWLVESAQNQ